MYLSRRLGFLLVKKLKIFDQMFFLCCFFSKNIKHRLQENFSPKNENYAIKLLFYVFFVFFSIKIHWTLAFFFEGRKKNPKKKF